MNNNLISSNLERSFYILQDHSIILYGLRWCMTCSSLSKNCFPLQRNNVIHVHNKVMPHARCAQVNSCIVTAFRMDVWIPYISGATIIVVDGIASGTIPYTIQ